MVDHDTGRLVWAAPGRDRAMLSEFRAEFYQCLTARRDELLELADAVLCTDGPVKTLVDLAPEHRRGHSALYDGLNHGRIQVARLRRMLGNRIGWARNRRSPAERTAGLAGEGHGSVVRRARSSEARPCGEHPPR